MALIIHMSGPLSTQGTGLYSVISRYMVSKFEIYISDNQNVIGGVSNIFRL